MGTEDTEEFVPFSQALALLKEDAQQGSSEEKYAISHLARNFDALSAFPEYKLSRLEKSLAAMGIRKVRPIGAGTRNAIFEMGGNQILRLNYGEREDSRSEALEILPNIAQDTVSGMKYEVLPKMVHFDDTENANIALSDRLIEKVKVKYGKTLYPEDEDDICFDKDGVPILVDAGSLRLGPAKPKYDPEYDKPWVVEAPEGVESRFAYLREHGLLSKYEVDFPAVHDQRVRDILSNEDIEKLQAGEIDAIRDEKPECLEGINAKNLDIFIELVSGEGLYPSQAQDALRAQGTLASVTSFAKRFPRGDIEKGV